MAKFAFTRRQFVKTSVAGMGIAVAAPFIKTEPARADSGKIVVVGWGGAWAKALREVQFEPFASATGVQVVDDTPPLLSKIQAMVQADNVTWDLIETDLPAVMALAEKKLVEPIDYSKIDPKILQAIPKNLQTPYGIGSNVFSTNIVYNTKAFAQGKQPKSWPDIWDGKAFPGPRAWNFGGGTSPLLEIGLLGDGVALEKLYPIDVERAWASFDRLKPLVTKWFPSHSQGIQLLSSGQAAATCSVAALAFAAIKDGAPLAVDFNQGRMSANYWAIVKGTKNRAAVDQFINFALDGKRQADMSARVPYGYTNPDALQHLSAEQAAILPSSPENVKKQFWWDVDWWSSIGEGGKTQREIQADRFVAWMVKN